MAAEWQTLRVKLLLPLLALITAIVLSYAMFSHRQFLHAMEERHVQMAHLLLRSVVEGVEGSNNSLSWQRLVEITAANREVLWIVVVDEDSSQVLASSRHLWRGYPVSTLPAHVRKDIERTLAGGDLTHFHHDDTSPRLDLGEVIHFQVSCQTELARGTVLLSVSTRDMGIELSEFRLRFLILLAAMLILPFVTVFRLMRDTVLEPVHHMIATMHRRAAGDRQARVVLKSGDELGRVAIAFNDLLETLDRQEADLLAVKTDTERHLAEAEATSRKYHNLVESTKAIAWEYDLAAGQYTYVSPTVKQVLGYPVAAWLSQSFWEEHLHPEDRGKIIGFSREMARQGKEHNLEYRMITADGRTVWLDDLVSVIPDAAGVPTLLRGLAVDITDKKMAQEEMWRHLQVEKALAFASRRFLEPRVDYDAILATIGHALGVNRAYIFRVRPDGIHFDNTHEWCREGTDSFINDLQELPMAQFSWFWSRVGLGEGDGNIVISDVLALPAGAEAEREEFLRQGIKALVCVPIGLAPGQVEGMLGVDDTEGTRVWREYHVTALRMVAEMTSSHWDRAAKEDEKLALQERAMRTAHLASLGMLSASVAHEINNPNNLIAFNTPLLGEVWRSLQPLLDQHAREQSDYTLAGIPYAELRNDIPRLIRGVEDASRRISAIVSQLKRLVRRDAGTPWEAVDLAKVVRDALSILHVPLQKKGCTIDVEVPEWLPPVWGRTAQLEQVVINVVMNALEAVGPHNGLIQVAIAASEGERVVISVTDNGRGIPPELLHRVTEPLFTTKSDQGGTGLGLAICRQIVELHYGHMTLASIPGQGTRVEIDLPVGEALRQEKSHGH